MRRPHSPAALRYAAALFKAAGESNSLSRTEQDLTAIDQALAASEDLRRLVGGALYTAAEKAKALDALLKKMQISDTVHNFVLLAIEKGRLFLLPDIIAAFRDLAAEARGETAAHVRSATPLSAAAEQELEAVLKGKFGAGVRLETETDPELLGGLTVQVKNLVIDASLRRRLDSIKTSLLE